MSNQYHPAGLTKRLLVEIELLLLEELEDSEYTRSLRWFRERLLHSIKEEPLTYRNLAMHLQRSRYLQRSA